MADLVNAAHKSALSHRNQESSHLPAAGTESLGGPGIEGSTGGDDYKIDADRGVKKDTSIPAAVGPEGSHRGELKEEDDDAEVSFDGDDDLKESDDLDAALDQFEDIDPLDVDVSLDEEDDEEEKLEEDENPFAKKDDDEKLDESEDEDGEKLEESEDEEKLEESDDKEDGEKLEEEDDEEEGKEITESLKVRIKLPKLSLNESVIPAKNQKKVAAIFEQAVRATTKQVTAQVQSHYKRLHESKLAKRDAVMAKQMDAYLSYVVEEWVKSNKVAIKNSLRTQLAEEFLTGLQRLFKEHYIDVPESKVNVVEQLTKKVEKLTKSLNEQHEQKLKLRRLAESANKARIVAEFARNMSESEASKLLKIAESTQYTTAKDFREKLSMLKESYFPAQAPAQKKSLPEETVVLKEEKSTQSSSGDPMVDAVVSALDRSAEQNKW